MPRKPVSQKASESEEKKVAPVASKPAPAAKPVVAESVSAEATTESKETSRAPRQMPTRETVEAEFKQLMSDVDAEMTRLKDTPAKSKGVKFLRTVNKRIRTLMSHALRVSRQKSTVRRASTGSGFQKPVQISSELASFTGWDPKEARSRVDVTKFICNYIKTHNLQNPTDRRQILIDNDAKLRGLLGYDTKTAEAPLTYYSLQTYLKKHFTSLPAPASASAPAPAPAAPVAAPAPKGARRVAVAH